MMTTRGFSIWRWVGGLLLCMGLVRCVPAQVPAQLASTPGPGAVIERDVFSTDLFSVPIPEGWRVITGSALFPPSVTLAAPGDCGLIVISLAGDAQTPSAPNCADETLRAWNQTIDQNNLSLHIAGLASVENEAAFEAIFSSITQGITIHVPSGD
ncbi:MAG: hypothetical protein KC547_00725 [Anaerolineae bacterium]|nr:hypothetical protein [Anaerolineae bacterium]MCA9910372.1 hypothetical protein [Anaerolineae bacterium]